MNGIFDSNRQGTPAVSASGMNGAEGIQATSDSAGIGVQGVSTGAAGEQFARAELASWAARNSVALECLARVMA